MDHPCKRIPIKQKYSISHLQSYTVARKKMYVNPLEFPTFLHKLLINAAAHKHILLKLIPHKQLYVLMALLEKKLSKSIVQGEKVYVNLWE